MKNIVITGVSTGIGLGCTRAFIKKGYRVFGSVRKQADADRLQQELGSNFVPLIFDVTNQETVLEAAQEVQKIIGNKGLDGLINNAGIAVAGPLLNLPLEDLKWQLDVNVVGVIGVTQAFAKMLGAQINCPHKPGRIVNISSMVGLMTPPFMGPYVASKHAVEGISGSLRAELMLYGIDLVVIGPGAVKTAIWEKGAAIDSSVYESTDYASSGKRFQRYIMNEAENGFTIEDFGQKILKIFETPNPKYRYALVPKKLTNWTIPRLLPKKVVDNFLGKKLFK
ncbi:MAG: SDR family oxidoreductase [Aureispira sp.]|nr:SDR family oxidoreductase [Aureispira sp.]